MWAVCTCTCLYSHFSHQTSPYRCDKLLFSPSLSIAWSHLAPTVAFWIALQMHTLCTIWTVCLLYCLAAAAGAGSSSVCRAALAPSVGSSSEDDEDRWQLRAICGGFRTHEWPMSSAFFFIFILDRCRHQTQPKLLFNGWLCLLSRLLVTVPRRSIFLLVLWLSLSHSCSLCYRGEHMGSLWSVRYLENNVVVVAVVNLQSTQRVCLYQWGNIILINLFVEQHYVQ